MSIGTIIPRATRRNNETQWPLGTRPTDKSLSDPLARSPAAKELGKRRSGQRVGRDRSEEGKHGLALAEVDVRHLLQEADVPASGGAAVLLGLFVGEEECQLERFRQCDELNLRGR
jgi:hypothetical protein